MMLLNKAPHLHRFLLFLLLALSIVGCRKRPYKHLTDKFNGTDHNDKIAVLQKLKTLGKKADSAAPEVGELLQDKKLRRLAAQTLSSMGKNAVYTLQKNLSSENSELREIAADALADIGKPAKSAIPSLVGMLDAKRNLEKQSALRAITAIGPTPDALRKGLTLLKDEERMNRLLLAQMLANGGKHSIPYIPELMKLSEDKYYKTREASILGLLALGPKAVPYLDDLLTADETSVRDVHRKYFLLKQIPKMKPKPTSFVPKLTLMLGYDSGHASSLTVMGLASNASIQMAAVQALLSFPQLPQKQKLSIILKGKEVLGKEENKQVKKRIQALLQAMKK